MAYVTVNDPEDVAAPTGVVTLILPLVAPLGTLAVICVGEFTVKVAFTPLNVTLVAPMNPLPVTVTFVPAGPLVGWKLVSTGRTSNVCLLVRVVPPFSLTVIGPVVPVAGT